MSASEVVQTAAQAAQGYDAIIKDYLIKAMDASGNAVDKAVSVVQEQAPILIKGMLQWYFTYNLIMFVVGVILIIGASVVAFKCHKAIQKNNTDEVAYLPLSVGYAVTIVTGLFMINLQWLKIWIAPELWLVEYAINLLK